MKKVVILSGALVLMIAGLAVARANRSERLGWCAHGPLGFIADQLDLSAAQKTQIKSIWQAESSTVASFIREFAAEQKQMNTASAEGNLDASKIQPIAESEASTLGKLVMEKEKLQSTIYLTVLTTEQREKADRWRQQWPTRLDGIADWVARAGGETPGSPAH